MESDVKIFGLTSMNLNSFFILCFEISLLCVIYVTTYIEFGSPEIEELLNATIEYKKLLDSYQNNFK